MPQRKRSPWGKEYEREEEKGGGKRNELGKEDENEEMDTENEGENIEEQERKGRKRKIIREMMKT